MDKLISWNQYINFNKKNVLQTSDKKLNDDSKKELEWYEIIGNDFKKKEISFVAVFTTIIDRWTKKEERKQFKTHKIFISTIHFKFVKKL